MILASFSTPFPRYTTKIYFTDIFVQKKEYLPGSEKFESEKVYIFL